MKKINRTMFISILVVLMYVMSACSGAAVGQSTNDQQSSGQAQDVVFTGTVDSMGGAQWTISGQAIAVDGSTSVDANIAVGDNVKVEARVGSDGSVTAISIETSKADDSNANSNDTNQNDNNANDDNSNLNDNQNDNSTSSNDNGNGNGNDNSNPADDQEVSGVVEAITADSITIGGVVYQIADFTEFKELITLGDSVKLHVIINADGTFTIREIEKSVGIGLDNSNSNGSDDNSNVSSNSNGDDHGGNGNDDNSNDDHGNDNGNSNDDKGNDNSNSNGNG